MEVRKDETGKKGQVYAEMLCDFMFKRLFGSEENKDVLIWFLNMILEDVDIIEVEFIPTEHLGMTEEDSKAVFDISCRCADGRSFIIEMQKGYQKHFRKRALFYTSYPINEQGRLARERFIREHESRNDGEKFRWDFDLKPVTVVALLNFKFEHEADWPAERYRSSYRLREDCSHEVMTDVLRFVFLELGRFKKRLWELESDFDKWMYLLKHMHEMVEIPEKFSDPKFKRLFILSEIGTFTPEQYSQYMKSLKDMSDYYNIIDTAAEEAEKRGLKKGREEGRAEGLEKGLEKGRAEESRSIALRLLAMGLTPEQIAKATTLSIEEINQLKS